MHGATLARTSRARIPFVAALCLAAAVIVPNAAASDGGAGAAPNPAEGAAEWDTTFVADPIVVTATRVETARRKVPGSVSVIEGEELRATGATSVLDAIASSSPGLYVTQRNVAGFGLGPGAAGQIAMRGIGGEAPNSQVLVLVDGRPDYVGLFGHPVPDAYALGEVERVEVLRGPASAVYGQNAMGGVIHILTRRQGAPGLRFPFRAEFGPWGTVDASATAAGMLHNGLDWRMTIGRTQTDGHRSDAPDDYERTQASGSIGWRRGPWDFRMQGAMVPIEGKDPGPEGGAPGLEIDITRYNGSLSATYHEGATTARVLPYVNWGRHEFSDGWDSYDRVIGVTAFASRALGRGYVATAGFDFSRAGGEAETRTETGVTDWGAYHIVETAPSLTLQAPVTSRITLAGTARAHHHTTYGWIFVPEGGVAVEALPVLTLRASASRGFRSPTIRDLYLLPPSDEDLEPERTVNVEFGAAWEMTRRVATEVSLWRMTGDNMILFTAPPPAYVNSGEFTHQGIEWELRWAHPLFRGRLFAAFQDLEDETIGKPEQMLGLTVSSRRHGFRVSGEARRVDRLYGANGRKDELPGYTLLNLTLARSIGAGVELQVAGRNLLDEDYETITGYPMPGAHAIFAIAAELGGE
ncbi:MAG: TonB-dependent receptor [Candidatus Eisenbacteria bacterium]|nr:TonB-dependent receptor [Candidatus Eisenbacteria bacterium]